MSNVRSGHFLPILNCPSSCILFGGITIQARKLGVFPQLRPPHPVMKGPWESIFPAYQMCFLIQILCVFHLPQPLNCLQLSSTKLCHPQSRVVKCSVFKTFLPSMFTLSSLQAKSMSEPVPGIPSSVSPSPSACVSVSLCGLPVWTVLASRPPVGHVTSPPGLTEASSHSSLPFMISL